MPLKRKNTEKLWSGKTLGTKAGHSSFFWLAKYFGRAGAGIFLIPVTIFYYLCMSQARGGSRQYFKQRFPNIKTWQRHLFGYKRVFSFANTLLDKVYLNVKGPEYFTVEFSDRDNVKEALKLGKGVLILSAHLGNWEVVSRFFKRFNTKVSVVVLEAERPEIKYIYDSLSQESTLPFTYIYSNDPFEALFQIRDALMRNEIVVMHGDRTTGKGILGEFFKRKALFPTFPYSIAAKTGSPIVVAFGIRLQKLTYRALAFPHFTLDDDSSEALLRGLKQYVSILEDVVSRYPLQWYNFYNFWDTNDA